ncbi:MAG TPA: hypothetical protein VGT40_03115, partial [Methylomirabilota bacterium]|nr:hypothetical protein [Methylomirabilota bacterium]
FAIQQACFAVLVADGHSDRVEAIERAELLTLEEAAKRLLIGTSTLEQGWRDFPYRTFRVRMGRAVRYSAARIAEWIRDPDGYACRHAGSGEPGTAAAPRPRKRGPRIGRSALRPVRGGEGAPS